MKRFESMHTHSGFEVLRGECLHLHVLVFI